MNIIIKTNIAGISSKMTGEGMDIFFMIQKDGIILFCKNCLDQCSKVLDQMYFWVDGRIWSIKKQFSSKNIQK